MVGVLLRGYCFCIFVIPGYRQIQIQTNSKRNKNPRIGANSGQIVIDNLNLDLLLYFETFTFTLKQTIMSKTKQQKCAELSLSKFVEIISLTIDFLSVFRLT